MKMNQEVYKIVKHLADQYANALAHRVSSRTEEMKSDDTSHYLLYRALGVSDEEGKLVDLYQNKGRFLYKYAGVFLEDATNACIQYAYPESAKVKIDNPFGSRPKTFEIDCLVGKLAHEIKWRDATTDGDHITKEHSRVKAIQAAGFVPVRIMFFYPQRAGARQIQETLETLYLGVGGQYYCGDRAWQYVKDFTGIDLLSILEVIAKEREQ